MKIEVGGKYALRKNPTEPVRVLCVDANEFGKTDYPIIILTKSGVGRRYHDGKSPLSEKLDLVPLRERLVRWGVEDKDGFYMGSFPEEHLAEKRHKLYGGRYFKMVEVDE